jgi:hypothetical protein
MTFLNPSSTKIFASLIVFAILEMNLSSEVALQMLISPQGALVPFVLRDGILREMWSEDS